MTYEDLLKEIVLNDDRYIVMTAENRTDIKNLPLVLGDKFIDTGITEQTLIGSACGLALRSRVPIVHAFASFLTMRAFEFIRTDIGIANLPVKMIGISPGILSGPLGPAHQAIEDVSLMRGIPNINIFCPADIQDLLIGLRAVIESANPFYIRYINENSEYLHSQEFEIGKAELISDGDDIGMLTYGYMFRHSLQAKEILESKGYSIRLINMRTLKPIDEKIILDTARKCKTLVIIEDHFITGGLYSITAEIFLKNQITAKVIPICFNNKWFKPALLDLTLEYEELTGEKIAGRILSGV
ncbi:MAG: transketolase [Ignavibacteriae bacterium]|nr:transketolase [Ignavibacteriota bacterium]